jgi:hypothetical protein
LQALKNNKIEEFPKLLQKVHKDHFMDATGRVKEPTKIGNQDVNG